MKDENDFRELSGKENNVFEDLRQRLSIWADAHKMEIGIAEMALGGAMITYGVNTGAIKMGVDLVASLTGKYRYIPRAAGAVSGVAGGSAACLASMILGGVGVAAAGGAVAVPAAIICGGAAFVCGVTGYSLASEIVNFLHPVDAGTLIEGGSFLTIGLALVLDGAQRVLPSAIKDKVSKFKQRTIHGITSGIITLVKCAGKVINYSKDELTGLYNKAFNKLQEYLAKPVVRNSVKGAICVGGGAGGAAAGAAFATSSVTILGSHALGSVALGLGLVSAPVWPVFVFAGTGVLAGFMAWIGVKKIFNLYSNEELLLMDLTCANINDSNCTDDNEDSAPRWRTKYECPFCGNTQRMFLSPGAEITCKKCGRKSPSKMWS